MTARRAAVVSLVAAMVYALMWVGYPQGWWHGIDFDLLGAAHDIGVHHRGWVWYWEGVSSVIPHPLQALGFALAVVAAVTGKGRMAILLAVCASPLNELVVTAAKDMAHRHRPSTMLAAVPGTSFPSGHALEITAFMCATVAFLWPMLSAWRRRAAVVLAAACVLLVGTARVALNVHHPSDVVAGWALGAFLFSVTWLIVNGRAQER